MSYIICDIDGTLANAEHRMAAIQKKPKDWTLFFSKISEDQICPEVDFLLKHLAGTQLVFVTGRPEEYRSQTVAWLARWGYEKYTLYMRKTGDFRQDNQVKQEIFQNEVKPMRGAPVFVVDDRNQVVAMWRSLGLTCFQVREGNF